MQPQDRKSMQTERVFSARGSYRDLLDTNILLHNQAAATAISALANWFRSDSQPAVLRVLDLACGGSPIVPCAFMKAFPDRYFDYCGVDINADQIAEARSHKFPPNAAPKLTQGDSWDPATWSDNGPFDIVYIGLNIHHAVPEELEYLARQLHTLIRMGGILINHDFFRPKEYPYYRRPERDTKTGISLSMVTNDRLRASGIHLQTEHEQCPDWRKAFFKDYTKAMKDCGMSQKMIDMTLQHVTERDYPVSTSEWSEVLDSCGFSAQEYSYHQSSEPLHDYFSTIVATRIK